MKEAVITKCVLDTSILIEVFDRGNKGLLKNLVLKYKVIYIPWICLYEYLYGHKYLDMDIEERKKAVEKLGRVVWDTQKLVLKALEIDVRLRKEGMAIPFSDVLIASITLMLNAELITLDKRHFDRIPKLKLYIPSITSQ